MLLKSFDSEKILYKSIDTMCNSNEAVNYPVKSSKILNSFKPLNLSYPMHTLRKGTLVMLFKNLKPLKMCDGIRIQIKVLHKNMIEAIILTRCTWNTVFAPRISLTINDTPLPLPLISHQSMLFYDDGAKL